MISQLDNGAPAQSEALSWLLEMEMLDNPVVLNAIILNVFKSIQGIKDVQFLIDQNRKSMLIYLEIGFWARTFLKTRIDAQVAEMIDTILPSFRKRVTFSREILDKALKISNF